MLVIPIVDRELCDACEDCIVVCPLLIFEIVDGKAMAVNSPEECTDCEACLAACVSDAITLQKSED